MLEAIDAGAPDATVERALVLRASPVPHSQAVLAAIEAAALDDEDRWHDVLTISALLTTTYGSSRSTPSRASRSLHREERTGPSVSGSSGQP